MALLGTRRSWRHALPLWLLMLTAGCGNCSQEPSAAPADATASPPGPAAPERWTLGAVDLRSALAIPPPCQPLSALRAAIERPTSVQSSPHTLDQIIGVQGPLMALGQGAPRNDAAGIYRMDHGRAEVTGLRWPALGSALAAHATAADSWLLAYPTEQGTRLWHAGHEQLLDRPVKDLRCGAQACGVLLRPTAAETGRATVRLGKLDEPLGQWRTVEMQPQEAEHARAAALLAVDAEQPAITVAFIDDVRVRLVTQRGTEPPELSASMQAPHGAIDLVATPQPAVLAHTGPTDARGCSPEAAGVLLVPATGPAVTLHSPLPPSEARLSPLSNGWLVTWRSPLRCESRQQLLYAAVVDAGGHAIGPVTSVTETSSYAVASRGDHVALWLVQDRTVSWLRWRCALSPR